MSSGGGGVVGGGGSGAVTVSSVEMGTEATGADPSSTSNCSSGTLGIVWAVTDISNVPIGSLLIDPQTLQPIVNADG